MAISQWTQVITSLIAREISSFTRYADCLWQYQPLPHESGTLFQEIECPNKKQLASQQELPELAPQERAMILLNGNLNHHLDIQGLLMSLKPRLVRAARVVVVAYNPYLRWLFLWATRIGWRQGEAPFTFITRTDLTNLAKLAGYEVVRVRPVGYAPFGWMIGRWLNQLLPTLPLVRWLGLANVIVLRPILPEVKRPSLSVIIPARNEKGNLEAALQRLEPFRRQVKLEVIFVEGHSNDGTWEEIQRLLPLYQDRFQLAAFQQTGKGKADAVRLGMEHTTGDLVTILDADLTMPPEMLERFYHAYCQGLADFINGNRLVYPMEGEAMRFLNRLGNVFFAKALSYVLDVQLGDSLCGTKLMTRRDYQRMMAWRRDFGDFDPFGDFEMIFPAAVLGLGVVDIPVYYRARTYGSTNISRFRHGWMLLKMTLTGLLRLKIGQTR